MRKPKPVDMIDDSLHVLIKDLRKEFSITSEDAIELIRKILSSYI